MGSHGVMGDVVSGESLGATISRLAQEDPERVVLTCGAERLSVHDLDRRTNRLARTYAALGARPGSCVTIALPNGIPFVEAVVATWKLGAVPQPVSSSLSAREIGEILSLVEPSLVVGLDAVRSDRPTVPLDARPDPSISDDPLPDAVSPSWKAPTSGGSTGRPKVIVAGEPGRTDELMVYADLYRIPPATTMLMTGPLYHNGPFMNSMLTILRGGPVVLMPRFDAAEALDLVAQERVASLYMVPTMMHRIWRLPEVVRDTADVGSIRNVLHTAAPCPAWLKLAWIEWLGPETILEIYGGTEAQAMTVLTGTEWLDHEGSVGRAGLGEVEVVDDQYRPCAPGRLGTIWLRRGPGAPPTYRYLGAEATRREGGWEWLGDSGHMDADGYVYVADRETDLILVGGSNVYPAEVEAVVDEHPLVASSCVVGLPHPDLGAVPHAIVQTAGGLGEEELRAHVAERLVRYKQPRTYEFVTGSLRDDSGKVRRAELRAERVGRASHG
jgi:bile acid-coenzyme A ligase